MPVGAEWRYAYLLGILPALLVVAVRASIAEPKKGVRAVAGSKVAGSVRELLADLR